MSWTKKNRSHPPLPQAVCAGRSELCIPANTPTHKPWCSWVTTPEHTLELPRVNQKNSNRTRKSATRNRSRTEPLFETFETFETPKVTLLRETIHTACLPRPKLTPSVLHICMPSQTWNKWGNIHASHSTMYQISNIYMSCYKQMWYHTHM